MPNSLLDIINWIAVIFNLIAYYSISNNKISAFGWFYQLVVFFVTIVFAYTNYIQHLYAFVFLNLVYLSINIDTIYKLIRTKKIKSDKEISQKTHTIKKNTCSKLLYFFIRIVK